MTKPIAKLVHRPLPQNFAATVGVLIVVGVFALAIGVALLVENEQRGNKVWPFNYFGSASIQQFHLQSGYGKI